MYLNFLQDGFFKDFFLVFSIRAFSFFFWLHHVLAAAFGIESSGSRACRLSCPEACGILVPLPGMETVPCITRWILNHWTTREVWERLPASLWVPPPRLSIRNCLQVEIQGGYKAHLIFIPFLRHHHCAPLVVQCQGSGGSYFMYLVQLSHCLQWEVQSSPCYHIMEVSHNMYL